MQVRRRVRGDALRLTTGRRQHPDHRAVAVGRILAGAADAQHRAVERQHVVVVVARDRSRIELCDRLGREVEPPQFAAAVEDQCLAVGGPVRCLDRDRRRVQHRPVPGLDVQHFEVAADVVAIRHPADLGRHDDADVGERRRLLHLRVVRAGEEADMDVGTEVRAVELGVDHRLAEPGHAHDEPAAFALQLDHVGVGDRGADRRCRPARDLPMLQRGEAVAMHRRVHVRRVGFEALAG